MIVKFYTFPGVGHKGTEQPVGDWCNANCPPRAGELVIVKGVKYRVEDVGWDGASVAKVVVTQQVRRSSSPPPPAYS